VFVSERSGIFICYRREEAGDIVGRLKDRLVRDKERVFVDLDMIAGIDWPREIEKRVSTSALLLAVIGPEWLKKLHDGLHSGNSQDFVRFEIETALRHGVPVIPVLIRNSTMPNIAELPDNIEELANRMAQPLRNDSFPEHYKRLKKAIDILLKSPTYARVLSVSAGLLLVFAGLGLAFVGWAQTDARPVQISDMVAALGIGIVGAAFLFTQQRWSGAYWLAAAGLFIGISPFVSLRIWRSAEVRGLPPWSSLNLLILLVCIALGLIVFLMTRNPEVELRSPRLVSDSAVVAIVCGVVTCVGLAAVGVTLPTSDTDLATLRFSDPMLLFFAVAIGIIVAFSEGVLRASILAGWTICAVSVLANTVWLRVHPEFRIPGVILNAHRLLSVFTVVILAGASILAFRITRASRIDIGAG
jgi:hypothetical protein